jgi:hypothetical protein
MKKHLLLTALLLCAGVSLNAAETATEVKEETKQEEVLPVTQTNPAPVAKEEEKKPAVAQEEEEVDLSDIDLDVEESEQPTE